MSEDIKNPAPPEILEERDRMIIRYGNTEVIQTKKGIKIQVRSRNHPILELTGER